MMKKSTVRPLDELEDVMVVERGLNGRSSNNVHLAVQLKFTNNDLLDVYEVNHRADAKRKVSRVYFGVGVAFEIFTAECFIGFWGDLFGCENILIFEIYMRVRDCQYVDFKTFF